MKPYTEEFYGLRNKNTEYAADLILTSLLELLPDISSAVDIGCGVGTWLSTLERKGVKRILGVDGEWVNPELLVIPKERFLPGNMVNGIHIEEKFDLAICLEVAEHLPADQAEEFIGTLTGLADFVLFSAAIPFQGGTNHVNEQWPEYWDELFNARDFVGFDFIRSAIWNNRNVPYYYRQNILLFVEKNRLDELHLETIRNNFKPIGLIHPEVYTTKINKYHSLKGSWKLYRNAVKRWFRSAYKQT